MIESMSNVSKGALLIPIYQFWFVFALLYSQGHVINRFAVIGGAIAVFGISFISAVMMANQEVSFIYPLERLFLGNLVPQYVVIHHFHADNLLMGSTLPSWWSLGNHEQFLLDIFTWKTLTHWTPGEPYYTAPTSFVADSFANFHLVGVFLIPFVVFTMLNFIDYCLSKIRSEPTYTALVVYSALHFSYWAGGSSLNFFFDYYYWGVLLFALVFYRKYVFK